MADEYNNDDILNTGSPYLGANNVDYAEELQTPLLPETEEEKVLRLQAEFLQFKEMKKAEEDGNIQSTQDELKQKQQIEKTKQEAIKLKEMESKTAEKVKNLSDPSAKAGLKTRSSGNTPVNLQDSVNQLDIVSPTIPQEDGGISRISEILRKNKDKNFVKRILDGGFNSIDNGDGSKSSHSMAYSEVDGRFIVYPTVVEQKGKLERLGQREAVEYALGSGENIPFKTEKEAEDFSKNYKKVWGKQPQNNIPIELQDGPTDLPVNSNIKQPIRGPFNKLKLPEGNPIPQPKVKAPLPKLADAPLTELTNLESDFQPKSNEELDGNMSPRQKLLQEFQALKDEREGALKSSKWGDFAANMGQALAQYGSDMGAVKAGMLGVPNIKRTQLKFNKNENYKNAVSEYDKKIKRLDKQSAILDKKEQLALIRKDKQELAKVAAKKEENRLKRQEEQDKLNKQYKEAQIKKLGKENSSLVSDDKGSPESRKAQQQTKSLLNGLNILYNEDEIDNLSANTLASKNFTAGIRKTVNKLQEKKEGRLTDKFGYTKIEKFENDARDTLKDMRSTDLWKTSEKSLGEINTINTLLDDAYKKGGQSLAMLGPKIARGIANEVGVLTEQDVTRYVKNPAIWQGMMDTLSKWEEGKITKTSYSNLKRLLEIAKDTNNSKLDKAIDREATMFSRREGIDYKEARYFIDNQYKYNKINTKKLIDKQDDIQKGNSKKVVVRKGYNPKTNQTQLIYNDGSKEIIEGEK